MWKSSDKNGDKDLKDKESSLTGQENRKDPSNKEISSRQQNAKPQESDDYQFLQEKIKERPVNRKKLLRNSIRTVTMAAVFGLVACVTFILLEPVLGNLISRDKEDKKKPIVVLPAEEDEIRPEDMILEDEDLEPDSEEVIEEQPEHPATISNAVTMMELQIQDYQKLYNKLGELANEAKKSVVTVTARSSDLDWFSDDQEKYRQESGLLVADNEEEYLIFCNYDDKITGSALFVTFCDGTEVEAVQKAYDASIRKAILAVDMSAVPESTKESIVYAKLGSSSNAIKGNVVLAVGSPMGYSDSVGYGMITSTHNPISVMDSNYTMMTTDIYGSTEASGVLVNMQGRVVGMIDQSFNSGDMKNQLSAIGISDLRSKIEALSNEAPIPYLGLRVTDVTKGAQEQLHVPKGAFILECAMNSPAMMVGIRKGDVVTAINDVIITNVSDYGKELMSYAPGDEISVSVMRITSDGYAEVDMNVTLQQKK